MGEAGFRYLDLHVGPGVFVPRPETEVVVDAALRSLPASGPAVAVDLGAGSGAISLAIATERPDTTVYAVELDAAAVPWLTQNVMRHAQLLREQNSKIMIVMGDAGAVAREDQPLWSLTGSVDLVVSNPPYIPDDHGPARSRGARLRSRRWRCTAARTGWTSCAAGWTPPRNCCGRARSWCWSTAMCRATTTECPGLLARHEDIVARGPVWQDVSDHLDLAGRSRFAMARRCGG